MRFCVAIFAIAVLLVVPIVIGVAVECGSLVAPERPIAHGVVPARAVAQPIALGCATLLRAPPATR